MSPTKHLVKVNGRELLTQHNTYNVCNTFFLIKFNKNLNLLHILLLLIILVNYLKNDTAKITGEEISTVLH